MPRDPSLQDAYTLRLQQLAEGSHDDPKALLARMLLFAERDEMPSGGLRGDAEVFLGVADPRRIELDDPAPLQVDERRWQISGPRNLLHAWAVKGNLLHGPLLAAALRNEGGTDEG